jgi:hypothetical protein
VAVIYSGVIFWGSFLKNFVYLFGSIWGCPKMAENSAKTSFLVVLDNFPLENEPNDLVRAYVKAKTSGHTFFLLSGLWQPFWVHLGVAKWPKMTQNSLKNLFSGYFGPFRLK